MSLIYHLVTYGLILFNGLYNNYVLHGHFIAMSNSFPYNPQDHKFGEMTELSVFPCHHWESPAHNVTSLNREDHVPAHALLWSFWRAWAGTIPQFFSVFHDRDVLWKSIGQLFSGMPFSLSLSDVLIRFRFCIFVRNITEGILLSSQCIISGGGFVFHWWCWPWSLG